VVDFRNAIIIMTSNIGSDIILQAEDISSVRDQVDALLHATFKPEFLNRLDEIITFNRLGREEIIRIVDIEVQRVADRLAERKMQIELDEEAKRLIADRGFDPAFGARPLKRTIQSMLQNPLSKKILAGEVKEGDRILVTRSGDELAMTTAQLTHA
jgi:ATP-dependent Clp protease ATP-binding subunit ClpB